MGLSNTPWQRRTGQQREVVEHKLSPPTVIDPTPLPLPEQRTLHMRPVTVAERTRLEMRLRAARCRLFPPRVITGSVLSVASPVSASTASLAGAPIVDPSPVLITAPEWRFVVTKLNSTVLTFLDRIATGRNVTYTLNKPAVATGTVTSDNPEINIAVEDADDPYLSEGNRLLFGFRREGATGGLPPWVCRFSGIILQLNDTVPSDVPKTQYSAFDPWEYLNHRPVVLPDGSFPGVNGYAFNGVSGGDIALTLLKNTIDNHGPVRIDAGTPNSGTVYYGMLTGAAMGATDPINITFQQGATVGEAWTQLCETGTMDIALRPFYDPINRPGYLCDLAIHATVGQNRPTAIFAWDLPSRSLIGVDRLEDGTQRANEVQFFLQGGIPIGTQADVASVAKYKEYWATQTMSGITSVSAAVGLAEEQLLVRKTGATTVKINIAPERAPIPISEYNIGDTVPIYASSRLRKPLAGYGRVYSIPIDIDDNSIERITALEFSADALTPITP